MKFGFHQFGSIYHSWGISSCEIARSLIKLGHNINYCPTDNRDNFPNDLLPYFKEKLNENYDVSIAYTAMHNFPNYLSHSKNNRFGIYNLDIGPNGKLPAHWVKYNKYADKIFPSSEYSKKIFINSGINENKLVVIPHGVNVNNFNVIPYQFKTKKNIKILNITGQTHYRKNLKGILEAYGKAFSNKDDVVLILKITEKQEENNKQFVVDFKKLYKQWLIKYPNHAEVEIINEFVPKVESLYLNCHIFFSLSSIECFHIPSLDAIAANLITISSDGGWADYLNKNNSLLVNGKLVRCEPQYQYWDFDRYSDRFEPDVEDAVDKLRYAYNNHSRLLEMFKPEMEKVATEFTWDRAAEKILKEVIL